MDLNERLAAVTAEYRQLMLEAKIKKAEADLLASHLGLRSGDDESHAGNGKPKKRKRLANGEWMRQIVETIRRIGRPCKSREVADSLGVGVTKVTGTMYNAIRKGVIIGKPTDKRLNSGNFIMEWSLPEWAAKEPSAVPAQQSETFAA